MQELSDELLNHIAGGLTKSDERDFRDTLKMMKDHGSSLEFVLEVIDMASVKALRQEYRDYAIQHWDQI